MATNTIAGRGGMLYLAPGTGAAVKVLNARSWKFTIDRTLDEDNAFGDTWVHQLSIIKKYTGSIAGNLDTTDNTIWSAAVADTESNFYLYPVATTTTAYYYGTAFFKLDLEVNLANVVRYTGDFEGQGALSVK